MQLFFEFLFSWFFLLEYDGIYSTHYEFCLLYILAYFTIVELWTYG